MKPAKNLLVSIRKHSFCLERFEKVGVQIIHVDAWNAERSKPIDLFSLKVRKNMQICALPDIFTSLAFFPSNWRFRHFRRSSNKNSSKVPAQVRIEVFLITIRQEKIWPICSFWHVECICGHTSLKLLGRQWQKISFFWRFRVFC